MHAYFVHYLEPKFTDVSNYTFSYTNKSLKGHFLNPSNFQVHYGEQSRFYKGFHTTAYETKSRAEPIFVVHSIEEAAYLVQVQKPSEMVGYIHLQ